MSFAFGGASVGRVAGDSHMGKKNRARQRATRQRMRDTGERYTAAWRNVEPGAAPLSPSFTPVEHECRCVIDWGWDTTTVSPPEFIHWCMQMVDLPCPWHGGLVSGLPVGGRGELLSVAAVATGKRFYARFAVGSDEDLGRRITAQLRKVTIQVLRTPNGQVPAELPERYKQWLHATDPDPMNGWLDQRLTDIVLNRGADFIPQLDALMARMPEAAAPAAPRTSHDECERCAFSAANELITCVCEHDWSCHGDVQENGRLREPCTHCSCPDMRRPDDSVPGAA
ncbi:hypothetical protein [Actinoplanes flavus]|uniref:Uncharacterized protein n=1 Tax=Actinoplanes flavus TaxID=2820290 RepID=A0ABS3USH2_9ACTN|nr:hypothetical protein [Actinoplanes flavus]MBO3741530.1 hypothetical protein [Actinoplanes flavus]